MKDSAIGRDFVDKEVGIPLFDRAREARYIWTSMGVDTDRRLLLALRLFLRCPRGRHVALYETVIGSQ